MMITDRIHAFVLKDVLGRFLRYVQVHTTSDDESTTIPSTRRQFDLLRMLADELRELGLDEVELTDNGFVYATLPARTGGQAPGFGLLAHVDTSPDQPGDGVKPVRHENWDGSPITFADDPELTLSVDDSEELRDCIGETIITASGRTLLGADDKAGVAEIMTAVAVWSKFPELPHGEVRICFTGDEEIGRGTEGLDFDRLPKFCYTVDGGPPGELEDECFDAWRARVHIKGIGVHPGFAKDKMINAARLASQYVAELPVDESPERTEGREGFFHITHLKGDCENAEIDMIIRDFEESRNRQRIELLETLKARFEARHPGCVITIDTQHQYHNMGEILRQNPEVLDKAERAIVDAGLTVNRKSIRGGTDGSALCQKGHPTPNLFAGGILFHSRREWIAESALTKAVETILHLARYWAQGS